MKYWVFCLFIFGLLSSHGVELSWDFQNGTKSDKTYVFSSQNSKLKGTLVSPVSAENGLVCGPEKNNRAKFGKLSFPECAIEINFKLEEPVSRQMTLFGYEEISWGRAYLGIYITPQSKIGVRFDAPTTEKKKQFMLESEPVTLTPGQEHKIRLSLRSDGMGQIFLDGKLLVEGDKACSFSDFSAPVGDQWHPFATVGYTLRRNKAEEYFNGVITWLAVYSSADAAVQAVNSSDVNLLLRKISKAPVIDGKFDDDCYHETEWTCPFLVLGAMSTDINGLWEAADQKFRKASSTATLFYSGDHLYAAIKAPFPPGMKPRIERSGGNIYRDDCVELFIRPGGEAIYQILANAEGAWLGIYYASPQATGQPWKPEGVKVAAAPNGDAFQVEIAIPFVEIGVKELPHGGELWYGNFARSGATCGGLSTWAPVGTLFFSPDRFGKFIFASRKDYFEARTIELEQHFVVLPEASRGKVSGEIAKLRRLIAGEGENPANWDMLHNRINSIRNALVQAANSGKTHLVWQHDPWGNFGPDIKVPFAMREVDELNLKSPKGARAATSFLVSNISPQAMFTSLKFEGDKALEPLVRFREIGFIELNGGRVIPDPVFELPLGSVLRVAPDNTAMIWLDIDCAKLASGTYNGTITLYPGYKDFEQKQIKLKLTVSPVDISGVYVRNWSYPLRWPRDIRALKEYEFNVAAVIPAQYFPQYDSNGKAVFPLIDEVIQAFSDNGVAQKDIFLLLYAEFPRWSNIKLADGRNVNFGDPDWEKEYGKRLLLLRDYLKEKYGMDYSRYALYTNDEPNGDPMDPKKSAYYAINGAKFVKSVDPKFQLFTNPWRVDDGYHQAYFDHFDILEPCYPRLGVHRNLIDTYRNSGREIWTYSVLEKTVSAGKYRHLFWENLDAGFDGAATFYDLFDMSGDGFNSYDANPKNQKLLADYGTVYRDNRTAQYAVSRRQEAWYQGLVDYKLAVFCRRKIAERNDIAAVKELNEIIDLGFKPNGNMDAARSRLLRLAEKLN